jgi:hypothetical protein
MHLSVPPCKDPNTPPRIQESDALVMCTLNFSITVSLFKNMHCKMKCLPGFFSPCNILDEPNLNSCIKLFLSINNCSLAELCHVTNSIVVPSLGLS